MLLINLLFFWHDAVKKSHVCWTQDSPHEQVILRDINRTFPAHDFFKEAGGSGQEALYRISKVSIRTVCVYVVWSAVIVIVTGTACHPWLLLSNLIAVWFSGWDVVLRPSVGTIIGGFGVPSIRSHFVDHERMTSRGWFSILDISASSSLRCFDTLGWATWRHPACINLLPCLQRLFFENRAKREVATEMNGSQTWTGLGDGVDDGGHRWL